MPCPGTRRSGCTHCHRHHTARCWRCAGIRPWSRSSRQCRSCRRHRPPWSPRKRRLDSRRPWCRHRHRRRRFRHSCCCTYTCLGLSSRTRRRCRPCLRCTPWLRRPCISWLHRHRQSCTDFRRRTAHRRRQPACSRRPCRSYPWCMDSCHRSRASSRARTCHSDRHHPGCMRYRRHHRAGRPMACVCSHSVRRTHPSCTACRRHRYPRRSVRCSRRLDRCTSPRSVRQPGKRSDRPRRRRARLGTCPRLCRWHPRLAPSRRSRASPGLPICCTRKSRTPLRPPAPVRTAARRCPRSMPLTCTRRQPDNRCRTCTRRHRSGPAHLRRHTRCR